MGERNDCTEKDDISRTLGVVAASRQWEESGTLSISLLLYSAMHIGPATQVDILSDWVT